MAFKILKKESENIVEFFKTAISDLNNFFPINWVENLPRLFVVSDKETVSSLWSGHNFEWTKGWVEGKNVYVLESPESAEFHALIKHELTHAFYLVFNQGKNLPVWLWEGVAIYLSDQNKFKKRPEKLNNFLDFFDKHSEVVYAEAGIAIESLINKFGEEKLLEFIKRTKDTKTREDVSSVFKVIYNTDLSYEIF